MKKKRYVVRVVMFQHQRQGEEGMLIEQLRYAGIATIHRDSERSLCFDLHCPAGLESEPWSKMNAERMKSFGYNAESCPSTQGIRDELPA